MIYGFSDYNETYNSKNDHVLLPKIHLRPAPFDDYRIKIPL